jgi:hypothetical protein
MIDLPTNADRGEPDQLSAHFVRHVDQTIAISSQVERREGQAAALTDHNWSFPDRLLR